MKPSIFLLIVVPRYVFAIVDMIVGVQSPCESIVDCLSSINATTTCYQGFCVPCRSSSQSCSNSAHCCSGSRCYHRRCTALFKTGEPCRLNRQCLDTDDFCIDRICTQCISLHSPCSDNPLSAPCCIGEGICRSGICQPAYTHSETCLNTFDCADELVCLSGTCQNPLGQC
jgi:hypothetical protein